MMNKKIIQISVLGLVALLVGAYGIFYYSHTYNAAKTSRTIHEQSYKKQVKNILPEMHVDEISMSYEQALQDDRSMENLYPYVVKLSDEEFFIKMYNDFKQLESYEEYKKYVQKYPELVPVIYAVRLKEKEVFLKFYGFLFDKILEEGGDMQDVKSVAGDLEGEELKQSLLKIFEDHYNLLIEGKVEFTGQFGDDPLNISLSNGTIEEIKGYCDSSSISGVNEETKAECYGYIYQFRANMENELCKKVQSGYQQTLCRGFLDYTSELHTN